MKRLWMANVILGAIAFFLAIALMHCLTAKGSQAKGKHIAEWRSW